MTAETVQRASFVLLLTLADFLAHEGTTVREAEPQSFRVHRAITTQTSLDSQLNIALPVLQDLNVTTGRLATNRGTNVRSGDSVQRARFIAITLSVLQERIAPRLELKESSTASMPLLDPMLQQLALTGHYRAKHLRSAQKEHRT